MAKIPYQKLPKKLTPSNALMLLLGTAAVQYLAITADFEGYVPVGYKDPVGIATKCLGDTTNVVVGKKYSFAECERSINEHSVEIIKPVRKCIKGFDNLPDKTKAAISSMAYNIGPKAMCDSSIVKYANAKNYTRMCNRMREIYLYATDRKTGKKVVLKGLEIRRNREADLCLEGVKEGRREVAENEKTINDIIESGAETSRMAPRNTRTAGDAQDKVVRESPAPLSLLDRVRAWLFGHL